MRKTTSALLTDVYLGDQALQRKNAEAGAAISMICNILDFLDASPLTLFEGPPEKDRERDQFFEDNLVAFISCLVSSNERVRKLAMRVAKRLFADESVLQPLRASKRIDSQEFKSNFWKLT